jgi:hypothetical protein
VASGAYLTCVPDAPGPLNVSVAVNDSNGAIFELRPTTVEVLSDPNASLTATPSEVEVGREVAFQARATGGSGGYRWSWVDLPGDCTNLTAATVECRANQSDLFPVLVEVNDSNGFQATSPTVSVAVYPDPSVSLRLSASSLLAGQGLSIAADPLGGLGPFTIAWTGLPGGCAPTPGPQIACNPSSSGTFHVRVEVTDALGGNASNTSTLTVAPSLLGLPLSEGVALIAGVAALVAGVTALTIYYLGRGRGSRRGPPERRRGVPPPSGTIGAPEPSGGPPTGMARGPPPTD